MALPSRQLTLPTTLRLIGGFTAIVAVLLGVAAPTGTASARPAGAARLSAAGETGDRTVRLITGQVVRVGAAGVVVMPPPAGDRTPLDGHVSVVRLEDRTYVIPAVAQPYLGRGLDPELFDVTRLAETTTPARTPIRVTLRRLARGQIPGLTVTARSSDILTGYFTPAGTTQFAQALTTRWSASQRSPAANNGLPLPGVVRIMAASPSDPGMPVPSATPAFQQTTLRVRVIDTHGAPVQFATVVLVNTDNSAKYQAFVPVVNGVAKVSVPLGHYSAETTVDTLSRRTGGRLASRIVIVTDYTVRGSGQTMTLDARTATARVGIYTPRPATLDVLQLEWYRLDSNGLQGAADTQNYYATPDTVVRVTPSSAARVGQQHWVTQWALHRSPVRGPAGTYDLLYNNERITADQRRTVRPGQLATVHARYFSDGQPRLAQFGRTPLIEGQYLITPLNLTTPTTRTEQVLSPPAVVWTSVFIGDAATSTSIISDGWRRYPAGSSRDVDWTRPALFAGFQAPTAHDQPFACPACRTRHEMWLNLAPWTDSTPGHVGSLDVPSSGRAVARLRVWQDGRLVADATNITEAAEPVSSGVATYRALFELDRRATGAQESTHVRTDYTFRSLAGTGPPLPTPMTCPTAGSPCRVLPLLQIHAALPVDLNGQIPRSRRAVVYVVVSHIAGAAPTPITHLAVQTSLNGTTWRTAPSHRTSAGLYRVVLPTTGIPAGHGVDIRIVARDAAGSTLRQTSWRAYTISES